MILLPSICDRRVLSAPYGLSPETGVLLEWKKKYTGIIRSPLWSPPILVQDAENAPIS